MRNYLDTGYVINQHRAATGRLFQELSYFDDTRFCGEVVEDEESQFLYRDGPGKLIRPAENFSYFKSINGYYSRGILHCKRAETELNLKIFPKGYFKGLDYPVTSMSFSGAVRKGINSGPTRIVVNNKTVCHTNFQDLVELIQAHKHPVGRDNHITTDNAWLNCLLIALSLTSFIVSAVDFGENLKVINTACITAGALFYLASLIESYLSATMTLLWKSPSWEDFTVFKQWFLELKKFRPVVTF